VTIPEPNGDVAKFANGDQAIISKLLADEILMYNKQSKKLIYIENIDEVIYSN
jgi:hypothetical protein